MSDRKPLTRRSSLILGIAFFVIALLPWLPHWISLTASSLLAGALGVLFVREWWNSRRDQEPTHRGRLEP